MVLLKFHDFKNTFSKMCKEKVLRKTQKSEEKIYSQKCGGRRFFFIFSFEREPSIAHRSSSSSSLSPRSPSARAFRSLLRFDTTSAESCCSQQQRYGGSRPQLVSWRQQRRRRALDASRRRRRRRFLRPPQPPPLHHRHHHTTPPSTSSSSPSPPRTA